jgi:uncharacterized protein (DUF433 family)
MVPVSSLEADMIDWSESEDVEIIPGKVSGALLVKGTRIPVQAVLDNAEDGYTAEQIAAEIYDGLPVDRARRIIAFARARLHARSA